jgi:hypothetical protein
MLGKRAWIPGTESPKKALLKSGAFAFSLLPSRTTRLRADNLLLILWRIAFDAGGSFLR